MVATAANCQLGPGTTVYGQKLSTKVQTSICYRYHNDIRILYTISQVLASMFLPFTPFQPAVSAQYYRADAHPGYDKWFCLALVTRERGIL